MEKEIICTVCPRGCHIQVEGERETVRQVTGYICKRGLEYATAEFTHPVRILTTTVKLDGEEHDLLPVRSAKPIPKEKLFACMEVIRTAVACGALRCDCTGYLRHRSGYCGNQSSQCVALCIRINRS